MEPGQEHTLTETESEGSGQQTLGVSPIRPQWPQQGASPIQQLPSQSSNLAPQLSPQGARPTQPQLSLDTFLIRPHLSPESSSSGILTQHPWTEIASHYTQPQWSQCARLSQPQWSQGARPTQPQWSQGARPTQPQWSQGARPTQPQWSKNARPTQPQWSQGARSIQPQWSQGARPIQLRWSSKGTRPYAYPQVLHRRANPTHLQDARRKKPLGKTQSTSPGKEAQGTSTRQQTQGTSTGQQEAQGTSTGQQQTQGTSTGQQQARSTRSRQEGKGTSTRQLVSCITAAETSWRQSIRDWYPNLHRQTYFIPPIYFNRVPYDVQPVAGQLVLVPREASNLPHQMPVVFNPSGLPSHFPASPLASQVWPDQPVPPGPLNVVMMCDVREDEAMQRVLDYIRDLAQRERLVMLVLSHLEFRKYLDNRVDPVNALAIHLLPRAVHMSPNDRGDFDILIISSQYGLIVGEVKAVGADPSMTPDINTAVVKRVEKALKQLNKAEATLSYLMADLQTFKITKTLMLPNITSTQLLQALSTHRQVQKALCHCVGVVVTDPAAAVARCLCSDNLTSSMWWQRAVTENGPDSNMTPDLYERLVARFGGPATTIEVPTVTTPRRAVQLRTLSEAVALTGLTMAMLTPYPEQVELVNRPRLPRVFLWGPPGSGKTVVLVTKGMQWGHQGKDVHLLSSYRHSRAATLLIERQLQHSLRAGAVLSSTPTLISTPVPTPTSTPTSGPRVYTHFYDFANEGDVEAAVEELASATRDGELFIIADEAFSDRHSNSSGRFAEFCTHLAARVPALHLWAAAVERDVTLACLCEETLTTPVRCPPAVVRMVQASELFDGSRVPRYSSRQVPVPTDGPAVRQIRHWLDHDCATLSPGHTGNKPKDCECCADLIADLIKELRVGQPGYDLQYRDTIILCQEPCDSLSVVTLLRACGLPVQVVRSLDNEAAIRDVALAVRDAVTVTDCNVVSGLQRRVVVVMGNGMFVDYERLYAMSRCTSFLVWAGEPLSGDDDDYGW